MKEKKKCQVARIHSLRGISEMSRIRTPTPANWYKYTGIHISLEKKCIHIELCYLIIFYPIHISHNSLLGEKFKITPTIHQHSFRLLFF